MDSYSLGVLEDKASFSKRKIGCSNFGQDFHQSGLKIDQQMDLEGLGVFGRGKSAHFGLE